MVIKPPVWLFCHYRIMVLPGRKWPSLSDSYRFPQFWLSLCAQRHRGSDSHSNRKRWTPDSIATGNLFINYFCHYLMHHNYSWSYIIYTTNRTKWPYIRNAIFCSLPHNIRLDHVSHVILLGNLHVSGNKAWVTINGVRCSLTLWTSWGSCQSISDGSCISL